MTEGIGSQTAENGQDKVEAMAICFGTVSTQEPFLDKELDSNTKSNNNNKLFPNKNMLPEACQPTSKIKSLQMISYGLCRET